MIKKSAPDTNPLNAKVKSAGTGVMLINSNTYKTVSPLFSHAAAATVWLQ